MKATLARLLAVALTLCLPVPTGAALAQDHGPPNPVINAPKTDTSAQTSATSAPAQTSATTATAQAQNPQQTAPGDQSHPRHSDRELKLSYSILMFGGVVLLVQYLLLRKPTRDAASILQLLSINLIVTGTLFLISAGFGAQEIAPGLGLFGTVAGYVLGRRSADGGQNSSSTREPDHAPP